MLAYRKRRKLLLKLCLLTALLVSAVLVFSSRGTGTALERIAVPSTGTPLERIAVPSTETACSKSASYSSILVVMVDQRLDYLRTLISSLSQVIGIDRCLLIFSHNRDWPEMNDLVRRQAKFAKRTVQIYFPYRLDLYPDKFPGTDPNDCPRSIGKRKVRLNVTYRCVQF